MRASDADRDRVVEVLRDAAVDGRLTADEFDVRLEAALSSRTLDELAVLTADLGAEPDHSGAATAQAEDVIRIGKRGGSVRREPDAQAIFCVQLAGHMCYGRIEARWRGLGP